MFPFIAALAQVGGVIIDKITLTRRRVEVHVYIPILFLFLFLGTALLFPFLGRVSAEIYEPRYLIIFFAMIASAIVWNIFYYQGVQAEKIHEFELIMMFQPLLTILLAAFFLGEQNLGVAIAAVVAAVSLILAHLKEKHLEVSAGGYKLILAVVFMSIELILIDLLLKVMSPVALYAVRTGIVFIFFLALYRPNYKRVANLNTALICGSALLGTLQMVTKFYGFEVYGVVYTSLILILAPIIEYIIATIFLHEPLRGRTIISGLVILGCIVYATVITR